MEDSGIELGWGYYLVILTLVAAILMEGVVKPLAQKLSDKVWRQKFELDNIKKWLRNRL